MRNQQYIWDQQYIDALVVRFYDADTDGSAVAHYATFDANMNLTAILDTSGNVVQRFSYDTYGQSHALDPDFTAYSGSDLDWRIRFQGTHYDTETGLHHVRNRMYHPTLGRWITRDPLGYPDGMNAYAGYHVMHGSVDPYGFVVAGGVLGGFAIWTEYLIIKEAALNAKAALDAGYDDIVYAEMQIIYDKLILAGNLTGAELAVKMLEHWRTGNGARIVLTDDEFDFVLGNELVQKKLIKKLIKQKKIPPKAGRINEWSVGRGIQVQLDYGSNPFSDRSEIHGALGEFTIRMKGEYCYIDENHVQINAQFAIVDDFKWDPGRTTNLPRGIVLYDDAWLIMENREPAAHKFDIGGVTNGTKEIIFEIP